MELERAFCTTDGEANELNDNEVIKQIEQAKQATQGMTYLYAMTVFNPYDDKSLRRGKPILIVTMEKYDTKITENYFNKTIKSDEISINPISIWVFTVNGHNKLYNYNGTIDKFTSKNELFKIVNRYLESTWYPELIGDINCYIHFHHDIGYHILSKKAATIK